MKKAIIHVMLVLNLSACGKTNAAVEPPAMALKLAEADEKRSLIPEQATAPPLSNPEEDRSYREYDEDSQEQEDSEYDGEPLLAANTYVFDLPGDYDDE